MFAFGVSEIKLGLLLPVWKLESCTLGRANHSRSRCQERASQTARAAPCVLGLPSAQLFPGRLGASACRGLLGSLASGAARPLVCWLSHRLRPSSRFLWRHSSSCGSCLVLCLRPTSSGRAAGVTSELDIGALVCRRVSVLLHKYQAANWPSESGSHQHQKSMASNGSDQVIQSMPPINGSTSQPA